MGADRPATPPSADLLHRAPRHLLRSVGSRPTAPALALTVPERGWGVEHFGPRRTSVSRGGDQGGVGHAFWPVTPPVAPRRLTRDDVAMAKPRRGPRFFSRRGHDLTVTDAAGREHHA